MLKSPFPALAILQRCVVGRLHKTNQPAFGNRAAFGMGNAAPGCARLELAAEFLMTTYTYTTIDPPGSTYTIANSINAEGQIVGLYQNSNGVEHGFLNSGGIYTTIDPPGSIETVADSINSKGQIIGWYFDSNGTHQEGFLDSGGIYTIIDPPAVTAPSLKASTTQTDRRGV